MESETLLANYGFILLVVILFVLLMIMSKCNATCTTGNSEGYTHYQACQSIPNINKTTCGQHAGCGWSEGVWGIGKGCWGITSVN
jgi:hypothetical protein